MSMVMVVGGLCAASAPADPIPPPGLSAEPDEASIGTNEDDGTLELLSFQGDEQDDDSTISEDVASGSADHFQILVRKDSGEQKKLFYKSLGYIVTGLVAADTDLALSGLVRVSAEWLEENEDDPVVVNSDNNDGVVVKFPRGVLRLHAANAGSGEGPVNGDVTVSAAWIDEGADGNEVLDPTVTYTSNGIQVNIPKPPASEAGLPVKGSAPTEVKDDGSQIVVAQRYDSETHQFQVKVRGVSVSDDTLVSVTPVSGWLMVEGGQCVEHQDHDTQAQSSEG